MVQTALIIAFTVTAFLLFFLGLSLYWCWKDKGNDNREETSDVATIIADEERRANEPGASHDVDVP